MDDGPHVDPLARELRKRFDLAERVMAEALLQEPPSADEFRRWHLRQSLHTMGAATAIDLRMYLTFPRVAVAERRRALAELARRSLARPRGASRPV